ncbi:GGDEF domain-containing protein [Devosia sp.]|uniref:GGDEF domain-containing protein n=1 Tax=Devosia sp. TaxID=1871048 RepID=UPI003A946C84
MHGTNWLLAPTGRMRVILGTSLGTLTCILVALGADSPNFESYSQDQLVRSVLLDVLLPLGLAGPALFYFLSKLRELAIAHEKLMIYASKDALTSVLNRGAFTSLVEAYLGDLGDADKLPTGAFLVIDADHFKRINDQFGHAQGDRALIVIADTLRAMVRSIDRVGRLGGEEFGIFLPGATIKEAEGVAERIRAGINTAHFSPDGTAKPLSVSIGGVAFSSQLCFNELFRLADKQLYFAKENGRNQVSVSPAISGDSRRLSAA